MRVFEVVEHHVADVKRVVAVGGSDELVTQLRLPDGLATADDESDGGPRAGDLVVVDVGPEPADVDGLGSTVAAVPEGATLLLLLRAPLTELPLGPVVTALTTAGLQVVEAAPVAHPTVTAAVVARHPDAGPLPFVPYLGGRPLVAADEDQLRRVVNEHLVEGLVNRARDVERDRLREELRTAQAELATAHVSLRDTVRALEAERARSAALEDSRTMAVGRAVAEVRRNPLRGLVRLPGALRRRR
jgi:hypothetical protein